MCCHQHDDHLGNGNITDTDVRRSVMDTENVVVWHNPLVPALIKFGWDHAFVSSRTHNKKEVHGYHGATVVGGGDGPEPLLASGIPGNRQINNLTGDCITFTQKIHNTLRLVCIITYTQHLCIYNGQSIEIYYCIESTQYYRNLRQVTKWTQGLIVTCAHYLPDL